MFLCLAVITDSNSKNVSCIFLSFCCFSLNPVLTKIDEKYGKTAAQTALRFLLQNDVVIIPKSVHKDRMQQNFDLFDFTLTAEEMAEIEALDGGENFH